MDLDEFRNQCYELLGPDLVKESGSILFNPFNTLKSGKYYLLGINPGGDPNLIEHNSICTHLNELENCETFMNQDWGSSKIQQRVKFLFNEILEQNVEEVCYSNLLFVRTKDVTSLKGNYKNLPEVMDRCWAVHDLILNTIKPKVLISMGTSYFDFLKNKIGCEVDIKEQRVDSGHGIWQIKILKGVYRYGIESLIALPHFSRYSIETNANFVRKVFDN